MGNNSGVITFLRILAATIPYQAGGIEVDVVGVFRLNPTNASITRGDTAVQMTVIYKRSA